MKKCEYSREGFWLGLLAYRCTPLEDGPSPGKLLQGRCLRANLPEFAALPTTVVKKHYRKNSGKHLPPLAKGSVVRFGDKPGPNTVQSPPLLLQGPAKYKPRIVGCLGATDDIFCKSAADISDNDSSPEREPVGPGQSASDNSPAAPARSPSRSPGQQSATDSAALASAVRDIPLTSPGPTPFPRRSAGTVQPPHYAVFNQVP